MVFSLVGASGEGEGEDVEVIVEGVEEASLLSAVEVRGVMFSLEWSEDARMSMEWYTSVIMDLAWA